MRVRTYMDLKYDEISETYDRAIQYFKVPGAFKKSVHLWRAGLREPYYFDFDLIVNDPYKCEDITILYKDKIEEILRQRRIDFIGFIEKSSGGTTGALRLAGAISIYTRIPSITIRMTKEVKYEKIKLPPVKGKAPQERMAGASGILVSDHSTTGSEILEAIDVVENNGGKVTDVITYTSVPKKTKWEKFRNRQVMFQSIWKIPDDLPEGRLKEEAKDLQDTR